MTEGIARAGFDIDLLHGKAREEAFARILCRATIECKSDSIARHTGNVFIEYQQHGRPSGIAITQADWWAIEYDTDCWIVQPTPRLKALARLAYQQRRIKQGGDGDNYDGVLIPLEWLTQPLAPR